MAETLEIKCPECQGSELFRIEGESTGASVLYKCEQEGCTIDTFLVKPSYVKIKEIQQENEPVNYDFLYESIKRQKCVICIGNDLVSSLPDERFENRFAKFLREKEEALNINVYEDSWFHFRPRANQSMTYSAIRKFYETENITEMETMKKLAYIPFHLYLSLSPDKKLYNNFNKHQVNCQYAFYNKTKTSKINPYGEPPNNQNPLIYNLLGDLDENNSLVLTYNDFYLYLKSILEGRGMDNELKADYIFGADDFIFLGVPFDMWYVHLFMRILQQHKDKLGAGKYAANVFFDKYTANSCYEQYNMTFISGNKPIETFVSGLLNYFVKKDQELFEAGDTMLLRALDFQFLEDMVKQSQFKAFFDYLLLKSKQLKQIEDLNEETKKQFPFNRILFFQSEFIQMNENTDLDNGTNNQKFVELKDGLTSFLSELKEQIPVLDHE